VNQERLTYGENSMCKISQLVKEIAEDVKSIRDKGEPGEVNL